MKILCLHGKGTSAQILEAQIAGFRALLPDHYEYIFIEGEEPFESYPEISNFFPGPYFCYYKDNSMKNVKNAHEYIQEIIEEDGPFDAVFGFSQGAALAASVILYHQIENPGALPLFRFALFICGDLPFARSSDKGVDVTREYMKGGVFHGDTVDEPDAADPPGTHLTNGEASARTVRKFVPAANKERVAIPTAHVYGENDKDLWKSLALVDMCDDKMRWTYSHQGAHEIPRQEDVYKKIVEVVHAATVRSDIMYM